MPLWHLHNYQAVLHVLSSTIFYYDVYNNMNQKYGIVVLEQTWLHTSEGKI